MDNPYFYEVDVPIHRTDNPAVQGTHIFAGKADSMAEAVRIVHEVYDAARAARQAGSEVPDQRPDGWGARGYRVGWELDWSEAEAGRWNNPYSWTRVSDLEL
ncbi:hypothetical protein [Streptomyces sp. NPDC050485]|uniref:hypothetical protein n=1 Tax=Streptomyces sp. NPDC050485 TaxID=3365617 RepID=UPI003790E39D